MASLESLLKKLINNPETDKKTLMLSALGLVREACNIHSSSSDVEYQNAAKEAYDILDKILIDFSVVEKTKQVLDVESVVEMESGKNSEEIPTQEINPKSKEEEKQEDFITVAISKNDVKKEIERIEERDKSEKAEGEYETVVFTQESVLSTNPFTRLIERWNAKVDTWFHMRVPENSTTMENSIIQVVHEAAAARSNLASASINNRSIKSTVKRFDRYWKSFVQLAQDEGFEVFPTSFGRISDPQGKVIYSCRPNLEKQENALLMPGLKNSGQELFPPLTLVTLPPSFDFPFDHPNRDLPPQWRAILGELELLIEHLELQNSVVCTMETVNKSNITPYSQCKQSLFAEIQRRAEALKNAIRNQENIYRLATNYWRVEECFWCIFHGDDRPIGHSFFDRLRRRVQKWRVTIRKENQLFVRDFSPGNDSLASINKYIGNIILQNKKGICNGTILREIRSALIVKVDKVSRVLKGRVIST